MSSRAAFRYFFKAFLCVLLVMAAGWCGKVWAQDKKTGVKEETSAAKEKEPEPVPSLFEIYVNAMKEQAARTAAQPTTTADEQVAEKEYFGLVNFLSGADNAKEELLKKKLPHIEQINNNGNAVKPYSEHIDAVTSLAVSRDGKWILSGSMDHTARLWDKDTGKTRQVFQDENNHRQGVTDVAFTPDGRYVVTASLDQSIRLWQMMSGKNIKSYRGLKDRIWSVAVAPNNTYLAGACNDGTIMCWSILNVKKLGKLEGHAGPVFDIEFSPMGPYLASAGADRTVRIWNMQTAEEITACSGHTDKVYSVVWAPSGQHVLSASRDKTARIWDAATGEELCRFVGHVGAVRKAIFMPVPTIEKTQGNGTGAPMGAQMSNGPMGGAQGPNLNVPFLVVTSSDDGTIRIWIPGQMNTKQKNGMTGANGMTGENDMLGGSPAGGDMMGGDDMMMGGGNNESAVGPNGKKKKKGSAERPVGKTKGIEICKYSLYDLSGQTIHTPISGLDIAATSINQFAVAYMDGLVRFWNIPNDILLTQDQKLAAEKKKKAAEKAGKK